MSTGCQKDRKTGRQTEDRQTEKQIERFFSLVMKTKVVQMSTGCQKAENTDMNFKLTGYGVKQERAL